MRRRNLWWLVIALLVPLMMWVAGPAGAEWAGTDDRIGELIEPAGTRLFDAPEWSGEAEQFLFLGQAGLGAVILAGSLWRMKTRRGQDS